MSAAELPVATEASAATLERLARFEAYGQPVLSLYIDLEPSGFAMPSARSSQLGSLLDQARRRGAAREAAEVAAWLDSQPQAARGAAGLAVFACTDADFFEVVRLSTAVAPLSVVDTIPWLEPLAATISPGGWGVAVISRRRARLFRGDRDGLSEFAAFDDDLYRRHSQGGWSQSRFQRGIEEQVAAHVRTVSDRLLRAHQRAAFAHLVVVCGSELRPLVTRDLNGQLRGRLAGIIDADLEHATVAEIAKAVAPVLRKAQRDHEQALIDELEQALATGGRAAAGLDEVLSTLEEQRVAILLVPERDSLRGGRCPTCGRIWTDGTTSCPVDGEQLLQIDCVEHAVKQAERQSAQVVVVRDHAQWLPEHGRIAALLRF
ncbi:MAG: baeRF10 domain-containing protein [Solirubrobacteraceae bacterium]